MKKRPNFQQGRANICADFEVSGWKCNPHLHFWDITICFCSNHYIIKYANSYYDFRGKIPQNAFGLELWGQGFVPFKNIHVAENVLEEEGIASLSGIVDKVKDYIWSLLEPSLLEEGQKYLKDVLGYSRQRKDTRH